MAIKYLQYQTKLEQYYAIAEQIQGLIAGGTEPGDIAIISRKHKSLEGVVPLLNQRGIPYYYEKSNNVLESQYINQILTMMRYVDQAISERQADVDYLLPEILAFPFWEIDELVLWKLARISYSNRSTWVETIMEGGLDSYSAEQSKKLQDIIQFLVETAQLVRTETAEFIIDRLVGVDESPTNVDENDDSEGADQDLGDSKHVFSPFKYYYFDRYVTQSIDGQPVADTGYLDLLSNLRVLLQAVRGHRGSETFTVADCLKFIDLLLNNGLSLPDKQVFNDKTDSVNLLSAHKSKGLEFGHVFVINANKSEWEARGRSMKLSFPANIPLVPDKDTVDDHIRLFFVALTRAKHNVIITSFARTEEGKTVEDISFTDFTWDEQPKQGDAEDLLQVYTFPNEVGDITDSHKEILKDAVADYQLSVTSLTNYLNVINGGPRAFLETNLLRFPQSKSKHAAYGSAVHDAIRALYVEFVRSNTLPSTEFLLDSFEKSLRKEGLSEGDMLERLEYGREQLLGYYQNRYKHFDPKSVIERDFRNYCVRIGDAQITGKIDKMDLNEEDKTIFVSDFKTGKYLKDWKQSGPSGKIKAWKYSIQLLFYRLLIENSSHYGDVYKVSTGALEFVEPDPTGSVIILQKHLGDEEVNQLAKLIQVVYNKIVNLDFPDTSHYSQSLKGVEMFIEDLLS